MSWLALAVPRVIAAILILVVGLWLARFAAKGVTRLIEKNGSIDPMLKGVLTKLVCYAVWAVVFVAALGQLGIQTTSIIAALGAIGLAIGLALQGTLSNIAAGIMLLFLRPFRLGEMIDIDGTACKVQQTGLFATELHSWDGVYQFVPNAELWNRHIVNYSRLPTRLIDLKFGIAYTDDIEIGKRVLLETAKSDERVHSVPEPNVFVSDLGADAVEITLRTRVDTDNYFPVLRALSEEGKNAIEAAGLSIPFPQRDVHHYNLPDFSAAEGSKQSS